MKRKKKKKKKKVLSAFCNFPSFHCFNIPPSFLQFSFFSSPFSPFSLFLLASFFPIGQQIFPGQKSLGGHSALPAPPPPGYATAHATFGTHAGGCLKSIFPLCRFPTNNFQMNSHVEQHHLKFLKFTSPFWSMLCNLGIFTDSNNIIFFNDI